MRYADPSLCPDCRRALAPAVARCEACDLPVRHPLAVQLFATLEQADSLIGRLRATVDVAPVATPQPAAAAQAAQPAQQVRQQPLPHYPSAGVTPFVPPPLPPVANPRTTSIPRLLLGLGALCLLVAAVVFLAVSWPLLGVAGRTAVLASLTALFAGAAALLVHRGLRLAAEAMTVLALGLLALDVLGAAAAGWWGDLPTGGAAVIAGTTVLVAAAITALLPEGRRALVTPQVVVPIALLTAYAGALPLLEGALLPGHLAIGAAAAVAIGAQQRGLTLLVSLCSTVAALLLTITTASALVALVADPRIDGLVGGPGAALLVGVVWMLLPGLVRRDRTLLQVGAAAAAVTWSFALLVPALDEGVEAAVWTTFGVTAAWTVALALAPAALRRAVAAPAATGVVALLAQSLVVGVDALARWSTLLDDEVLRRSITLRLPAESGVGVPWSVAPTLLLAAAVVVLVQRDRARLRGLDLTMLAAALGVVGLSATLATLGVPLAVPVGVLALAGIATTGAAMTTASLRERAQLLGCLGVAVSSLAALLALPSAPLTALVAAAGAVVALTAACLAPAALRVIGGCVAAPLVALATAATLVASGADLGWIAVPVLIATGLVALVLARVEVEVAAVVAALLALPVSVDDVVDPGGLLALWLAVAGALLASSAILHERRRPLAWAAGAVFLLASWVRLSDLSVTTPEAYTLPLAAAVTLLGLHRMRTTSTGSVAALTPGLLLATVPSLLWVLGDPVSARTLALGAAALALAIGGSALRWTAPLVIGSAVLAVIVLRALGPYAGSVPTWAWLAAAGTLLTVVGTTWERRLLEVRGAIVALERLR